MQDKKYLFSKSLMNNGPSLLIYNISLRNLVVDLFSRYISDEVKNFLAISPFLDIFEKMLIKYKGKGVTIIIDDLLKLLVLGHLLASSKHMLRNYLIIISDIDIIYRSSIINYNLSKCISWLNELLSLLNIYFKNSVILQPISNKEYLYKSIYTKMLFKNVKNIIEISEEGANILRSVYS